MSVTVTWSNDVTVAETLTSGVTGASNPIIRHNGFNAPKSGEAEVATLTASTTPAATKVAEGNLALTAGAYTIDLTSLTGTNGASVTFNGLTVRNILIRNKGAAAMTFAKGASNGYTGFGSAFSITIPSGGVMSLYTHTLSGAVGGSSKTIDVTGTGTQTFDIIVTAG